MRRSPILLALLSASGLVLVGCGSGDGAAAGGDNEAPTVVTSTNVYASLAEAVAGDGAEVLPIIDDPVQDPHEYEATARDQLELSRADVVVMNGGGYDSFMTTMLEAADSEPSVVDAVAASDLPGAEEAATSGHDHGVHDHEGHDHEGHDHEGHDHGSFNEHVWYSVPTMIALVDEVETHLAEAAPDGAETFAENAEAVRGELTDLHERIESLAETRGGANAAVTEPVALWLFEDLGLTNVIPDDFVSAVEMGSDVSPIVAAESTEALDDDVSVFAYNTQTSGPQAEALRSEADERGIPVIDVTETMPDGTDYVTWMTETVDAVEQEIA